MNPNHNEKIAEAIQKTAADFFNQKSNRKSLITFTSCQMSESGRKAVLYLTVLPEEYEQEVLKFCRRQLKNFVIYFKKRNKIGFLPKIEIEIDKGEKNRQKIEEIIAQEENKAW